MKESHRENQKGFIALISVIIISVVLLATTISLAQFGIANRYFILHLEQKAVSEKLADACVHIARILVYNDPETSFVTPNDPYPIGEEECTIESIAEDTPFAGQSTVRVSADSGDSVTNFSVVINTTNGNFVSWTELASF